MSDVNTPVIIEASDISLIATQAGNEFYNEPGIAFLADGQDKPLLGHQAQKSLRQQPTRIHSRYWSELSTDSLQINNTHIRHSADLVWHQINQIKSGLKSDTKDICFCLPSNVSQQQMQLLTGICQSLDLQAGLLINLGLAQLLGSSDIRLNRHVEITHVDLQLHQLVISTYINQSEKGLELKEQETIQDISFLRFVDHLLHLLRDKFIQNSRFDPLHSGDTEQQLFDQLIHLIETGEHSPFQINSPQKQHKIELSIQEFESHVQDFKAELTRRLSDSGFRAYAPVFSLLPGFKCTDSELMLTRADTTQGASLLTSRQQTADGTTYISHAQRVPTVQDDANAKPDLNPEPESNSEKQSANALLYKHQVYTQSTLTESGISTDCIAFGKTLTVAAPEQMLVNNSQPVPGQQLFAGDKVNVAGCECIAVRIAGVQ